MTTLPDLADIKGWLRVEHDDEDALLAALLGAAVSALEEETSLCFEPRTLTQRCVAGFPLSSGSLLKLWKGPVQSIGLVEYDPPSGGVAETLASFRLVEGRGGGLLPSYGAGWPSTLSGAGTVRVTYVAGFEAGELPGVLAQAVRLLTGHWYGNRGEGASGVPGWIKAMVAPFASVGLA